MRAIASLYSAYMKCQLQAFEYLQVVISRDTKNPQIIPNDKYRQLRVTRNNNRARQAISRVYAVVTFFPNERATDVEEKLLEPLPVHRRYARHKITPLLAPAAYLGR